jgi:hypothetical protein
MKQALKMGKLSDRWSWSIGLIILWMGGLALAGCGSTQAAPTLIPTIALPTAAPTPSALPALSRPSPTPFATNFPTWRSVTLMDRQSFDFRQETMGAPTEGDLYYSTFDAQQGTACFWANNTAQVGGRDLGAWSLTALTERPLPRERFSGQCVPVIRGHVYVYGIQGDERLAVFRVSDAGLEQVTLEFILRK